MATIEQSVRQTVDLFDKCRRFTAAREMMDRGLYPYFQPIQESHDTEVVIRGETKIMVGSNNYLGLTHHPYVLERARDALFRYGTGNTGSRFLNGTLDLHERLEHRLAALEAEVEILAVDTAARRSDLEESDALRHRLVAALDQAQAAHERAGLLVRVRRDEEADPQSHARDQGAHEPAQRARRDGRADDCEHEEVEDSHGYFRFLILDFLNCEAGY